MRYFFVGTFSDSLNSNGGQSVFDRNVISELGAGVGLHPVAIGSRDFGLPVWRRHLQRRKLPYESDLNVVSHELLGDLCGVYGPTCFIVHNYFPGLVAKSYFARTLFRLGAKRYFERCFSESEIVVFLSLFDLRNAASDFPIFENRMRLFIPGIKNEWVPPLDSRRSVNIGQTGSNDWYLKRVAARRFRAIVGDSVLLEDFEPTQHYISIIKDDFTVGFKLKLVELMQNFQRVISFTDLSTEVKDLGVPISFSYVRTKTEFLDAYHSFCKMGDYSLKEKLNIKRAVERFRWSGFSEVLG